MSEPQLFCGSLDRTFGSDGKIINATVVNLCGLTRLSDGKIVVAGSYASGGELRFAATRYNADGTLDMGFGVNGYAIGTSGAAKALAFQPDGKIIIAGDALFDAASSEDFLLERFDADGNVDQTFGTNGFVRTDFFGGADRVSSIVVQPEGRIVAAGFATADAKISGTIRRDFALAGYDSNGVLDPSFGDDGFSTAQFSRQNLAQIQNLVAQPDGKMVVVGSHTSTGEGMAMARYDYNGILDGTFGNNDGKIIMDYPGITSAVIFRAVAIERSGKMLSLAAPTADAAQRDFFLLARCTRFGEVDRTLDGEGEVLVQFGSNTVASSVITLPDGKTIVAGVSDGNFFAARFVAPRPAQFDFDGDGRADIAVFRPSDGNWYWLGSRNNSYSIVHFGQSGDVPVVADYDGDGRSDYAVYRGGTWYIQRSTAGLLITQFGISSDKPVPADYDGEGKTDIAVYCGSTGEWWINRSASGTIVFRFGTATDKAVPADFTGDGKADVAFFRPSTGEWFVLRSEDQSYYSAPFGQSGDIPVAGDYDGDGKSDMAVYRGGQWWIWQSRTGNYSVQQFGNTGDRPVPSAYLQ